MKYLQCFFKCSGFVRKYLTQNNKINKECGSHQRVNIINVIYTRNNQINVEIS